MAATLTKIEQLKKKFKNVEIKVLNITDDGRKADVFAIWYNRNGANPNKVGAGLVEVNALWDERQSRPKGYFIAAGFERTNGQCVSVMVSEEWLDNNKVSEFKPKWEVEL